MLAAGGVIAGLGLLIRGLLQHRSTIRVGDTATSTISSMAAGEVRISGIVEAAELTLVSLLQSVPCVYYRSTIGRTDGAPAFQGGTEERTVGFRVRDGTGSIRVFPRGARFDAPIRFNEESGGLGPEPSGLSIRSGGSTRPSALNRETAIAELLRVPVPDEGGALDALRAPDRPQSYREARLEIGDAVTIIGRALPFSDLADPVASDYGFETAWLDTDPEIAADLAEARASGTLTGDPEEAWGNAAIPGFGIGRPVTAPQIDLAARQLPLATAAQADSAEQIFEIEVRESSTAALEAWLRSDDTTFFDEIDEDWRGV